MPRPEHCPWNLYCVIKECWSYQVILELYLYLYLSYQEIFGVVRWLFVCLSDSSTYSKHVKIYEIHQYSNKSFQPEARPTWQTLVATLRSLYNQVAIFWKHHHQHHCHHCHHHNHHNHHQGETWDLLGAALRSEPPHPHLFPRELMRSFEKTGERNAHDEGLFKKRGNNL